jgi:pimeloyl-ACP methyl ester carboxylesterase
MNRQREQLEVAGLHAWHWPSDGPTVIGLPGLGATGAMWTPLAGDVPTVRIVAPDLRGRAGSARVPGQPGLRNHARDIARIADELDLRDIILVGHSMGAFLAPVAAQELGDRVVRLVLIDGGLPPKLPFFMGPALTRMTFRRDLKKFDRPWPDAESYTKAVLATVLTTRPELLPRIVEWTAEGLAGPPGALRPAVNIDLTVADAVDTFFGPDKAAIGTLKVPAHLIAAEHSKNDKDRRFLADSVLDQWTSTVPLLTAERVEANHFTVLFDSAVVRAVAG